MLAVLGDYLKHLNSEIQSYEQLIVQKREEALKLTQLQGQVVEALGILKNVVDELQKVDPEAIATIKTAALQIFDNGSQPNPHLPKANDNSVELKIEPSVIAAENPFELTENSPVQLKLEALAVDAENPLEASEKKDSLEIENDQLPENPTESGSAQEDSNFIRLSENVVYEPDKATIYAGINAYNCAKAWGEWLCFTHTVGDRFEVLNKSRSEDYNYDLVVFGIEPEDAQRLADSDLTKQPNTPENASWQPPKRHPQAAPPRPQVCQPGDLAVGDMARKPDGREYRVIGVSDDGSVVKVVNEDNLEMAFSIGALYIVKKAEPEPNGNWLSRTCGDKNGLLK